MKKLSFLLLVNVILTCLPGFARAECRPYPGPSNRPFLKAAIDYSPPKPYDLRVVKSASGFLYHSTELTAIVSQKNSGCTVGKVNALLKKHSACISFSQRRDPVVTISVPPQPSEEALTELGKKLEGEGCFSSVALVIEPEPA